MGRHRLDGPAAKVKRAATHLDALHKESKQFVNTPPKPYEFISKVDVETSRYLMRIRILKEPPVEWSLIVGDFLHNLRGALDHLVWQLVLENGEKPTGRSAFPIFDEEPPDDPCNRDRKRWEANVAGIHPDAVTFIELCQPYKRRDAPEHHLFRALRTLSNEDKHRTLIPALTAIHGRRDQMKIDIAASRDVKPGKGGQVYTGRPLKDGDLVFEAPVEITGPNPELKVEGDFPLDIGFGRKPVPLEGFRQMIKAVTDVVAASRQFFD